MPKILRRTIAVLVAAVMVAVMPMPGAVWQGDAIAKTQAKKTTKTVKAKKKRTTRQKTLRPVRHPTIEKPSSSALVVNAETGEILFEENADEPRHPASLTKMMTLYLLFDALKHKRLDLDALLPVSRKAASQPAMNMALPSGDQITVETAIECLVVRSANDVAMVVAEALAGSQEEFSAMMNKTAQALGMKDTRFYNPSGLPDDRQITTAYDMAKLAIALQRDFPQYYSYFSLQEFRFRGRNYPGHNRLLGRYPGADGVKTGYIRASGYNLVTSAIRGRWRLVGVVIGGRTAASRDQQMMDMLDDVFTRLAAPQGRGSAPNFRAFGG